MKARSLWEPCTRSVCRSIRGTAPGRAVLDGRTIHVADMSQETAEFPESTVNAQRMGFRTNLCAPLLREGNAIGVIALRRSEVRPFTERQSALLETFADQAVIAIENVRLFTEVQTRNRELTESLEQQTATSEVLKAISRSTFDLMPVLAMLAESVTRLCRAQHGHIFRVDGQLLRFAVGYGTITRADKVFRRSPRPDRAGIHLGQGGGRQTAGAHPRRSGRGRIPVRRSRHAGRLAHRACGSDAPGGDAFGVIAIWKTKVEPFTDQQIALVQTFSDQAVIAIENTRLLGELQSRNADLTESLEQQTATSEILNVISSSPTDVQPVFDAIARNAAILCEPTNSGVFRFADGLIHLAAHHNWTAKEVEAVLSVFPMPTRPRERDGPGHSHPGGGSGHRPSDGSRIHGDYHSAGWVQDRAVRADAAGGTADRGDQRHAEGGPALHREADRSPPDLRRSGRDRDRERPAVRRTWRRATPS